MFTPNLNNVMWSDVIYRICFVLCVVLIAIGLYQPVIENGRIFFNIGFIFLFIGGFSRALFGDVLRGSGALTAIIAVAFLVGLYANAVM